MIEGCFTGGWSWGSGDLTLSYPSFSFYAGSTGFEAFFTKDLVLVVAVCSKKRGYKTISVTEPLTPQEWVRG